MIILFQATRFSAPHYFLVWVIASFGFCHDGTALRCQSSQSTDPRQQSAGWPDLATPNYVIIYLDDAGYGDFGCYGHPTIRTPNIDRMASQGMKFTQFYTPSPACSASRYSLLTGRYANRSGFPWVIMPDSTQGIDVDEITVAEALKPMGYRTACFGKWHLGHQFEHLPLQNGFDEYFGIPYSNDMQQPSHPKLPLIEGNEVVEYEPDQALLTKRLTGRAVEFIEQHQDMPFLLYLAHPMPHVPLHASEQFRNRSKRGLYGDVIEELDWSVGEILRAIHNAKLDERTLVIVTSDNGPWIIKQTAGGSAGLLRDGKGSTWEGGVRVPCIAQWVSVIKAGSVCQEPLATIDLLPTLVKLAGGQLPSERPMDGRDMSKCFMGEALPERPIFFFGPRNTIQAVRKGPWKLHVQTASQTGVKHFDGRVPLLFHLNHDPSENIDLAATHPAVVSELTQLIEGYAADASEK